MAEPLDPTTPAGVAHLARLSRLALGEEERAAMAAHLRQMLDFVSVLDGLDTEGVEAGSVVDWGPTTDPEPAARADEPGACLSAEEALGNAPARGAGGFLVPAILEE